jgi:hypothetical protein
MEFDVFSSPLPDVAAGVVVQAVSGLSAEGVVVWATAEPTLSTPAKIAAATRIILISVGLKMACLGENVLLQRWFRTIAAPFR